MKFSMTKNEESEISFLPFHNEWYLIFRRNPNIRKFSTKRRQIYTLFFYMQRFFSTQPQCSLTSPWIELQMLLRCCLVHISIVLLNTFLFSIFVSMSSRIISWIQTHLFFCLFFRICPSISGWKMWIVFKYQKFRLMVLFKICLIFANFSLALLKSVAYTKKRVMRNNILRIPLMFWHYICNWVFHKKI